jgi:simple sugar transport system permease protein
MDLTPLDTELLQSTVRLSIPLALAAIGETVAERTGMLNIGLEGMMLSGALGAVLGGHALGDPLLGAVCGAVAGALVAAIASLFMITLKADQVVVGVGLVLFAGGLTTFLFREYVEPGTKIGPLPAHAIPLLSDIPLVGPALFDQNVLAYAAYILVLGTALIVNRSSWGLMIRAAGQGPRALDASGHSVTLTRWFGMVFAGALAGLGGAYLSVGQLGSFNENMTNGRGYIALAAVVFGGWAISRVVGACLIFGGVNALQLRLQAIGGTTLGTWIGLAVVVVIVAGLVIARRVRPARAGRATAAAASSLLRSGGAVVLAVLAVVGAVVLVIAKPEAHLPTQLYGGLPYVCALLVLAGFGRTRAAPAALTLPYDRDSR